MRLRALTAALLAALGAAACAHAAGRPLASAGAASRVTVVGDSLAEGTAPYLQSLLPGFAVVQSFDVGRHTPEGIDVLRAEAGTLGRYVLVSLGTNDDPRGVAAFHAEVESVLSLAGPSRCVVWANIVRPPAAGTSYDGYNNVLLSAVLLHRNFRLVDWASMARFHPEWLASDGVHSSASGYRARAQAYAAAMRSC